MALLRNQRSFIFPAPPPSPAGPSTTVSPSPIPTGKGLKSAAVDDEILAAYLENTQRVPDLNLPQPLSLAIAQRRSPAEIDLRLLLSGDDDSIRQTLGSAVQYGVFKIIGHGISVDELKSMMEEAELVFQIPVELKRDLNRGKLDLRGEIGPERNRSLSRRMDYIFRELEAIADMVGQILSEYMGKKRRKGVQGMDPILCLHKSMGPDLSYNESYHYALSFFLSGTDHEFLVQSARGPLSFNAMAGSIVVTVRKQLQEWSSGELKAASGEPNLVLNSDGSPSFFVEFMCTPSTLSNNPNQVRKISLLDQILMVLILCFLYNVFTYISSSFRGT